MNKKNLVAVYGSLRNGMGNRGIMDALGKEHYEELGTTVLSPNYNLFPVGFGGFPGVIEGNNPLTVEVFKVTDDLLEGPLDGLEGYIPERPESSFYIRKEVETEFGKAWLYFINRKQQNDTIEHGDWVKFKKEQ